MKREESKQLSNSTRRLAFGGVTLYYPRHALSACYWLSAESREGTRDKAMPEADSWRAIRRYLMGTLSWGGGVYRRGLYPFGHLAPLSLEVLGEQKQPQS